MKIPNTFLKREGLEEKTKQLLEEAKLKPKEKDFHKEVQKISVMNYAQKLWQKKLTKGLALFAVASGIFFYGMKYQEQDYKIQPNPMTLAVDKTSNIGKMLYSPLEGKATRWKGGNYVRDGETPDSITYELEKDVNGDGKNYQVYKVYDCKSNLVENVSVSEDFDFDGKEDKITFIRRTGYHGEVGPVVITRYNNFNPENPDKKGIYKKEVIFWRTKDGGFASYEEVGSIRKRMFYFDMDFKPASFEPDFKKEKVFFKDNEQKYPEYFSNALEHAKGLKCLFAGEDENKK